jgi:hypothetical protein
LSVPYCRADDAAVAKAAAASKSDDGERFWLQAEYLFWWTRGNSLPPLVTTSPAGTPQNQAGVVPGSQILFGGKSVDGEGRDGARLAFGYWLEPEKHWAVEAGVDWLGDKGGTRFADSSSGSEFLARPFFNAITQAPDAMFIAAPGLTSGDVLSSTYTQALTASAGLRKNWRASDRWRIDWVGGYRYLQYRERLTVRQNSTVTGGDAVPEGTTINGVDDFGVNNNFHGGEAGVSAEWRRGRWFGSVTPEIALGVVKKSAHVAGDTVIDGGEPLEGDLLALSSNIGNRSRNSFAALPEARVAGGFAPCGHLRLTLAYTVRYLSDALQTGGQIDTTVNPDLVPPGEGGGPDRPEPRMHAAGVWWQGVNAGIELRF